MTKKTQLDLFCSQASRTGSITQPIVSTIESQTSFKKKSIKFNPAPEPAKKPKTVPKNSATPNVLTTGPSADALLTSNQNLDTGLKSFQCSMCGYTTGHKGTVKRHIELKHLPKTANALKCQMCEYATNLRFNMKSHYIKKHSVPEQAAATMVS